jgi:hypothetical protein
MGWASRLIEQLQQGHTVEFRPHGNSMTGKVNSGDLCTVAPIQSDADLAQGSVVLCKVRGREYLHLISAVRGDQYQISNNHGHVNGWTTRRQIYGKLVNVSN